jgi:hypothetical protein
MQSGPRDTGTEGPRDAAARGDAMTFMNSESPILEQGRAAVAEWREQNLEGTADQLVEAIGPQFPDDFGPVLRGMLFRYDQDQPGSTAWDRR